MPLLIVLYPIAIFLGSFLLFLIEPIVGKRLLPLLGGSSAVWVTCLVFFQVALLLGYACAHWVATRLRPRSQAFAYTLLLLAGISQGLLAVSPQLHASTSHPILSVFGLLTLLIGAPFLVLSATNPLLQSWYSNVFAEAGSVNNLASPYRLFALSNFGSLLALVIYPWLVEPRFTLRTQTLVWLVAFCAFAIACMAIMWIGPSRVADGLSHQQNEPIRSTPPGVREKFLWVLLPACGSLLFCAVTNHLSQNIAAIPLLWILPLTAYLLSFVVAFSRGPWYPRLFATRVPVLAGI